MAEVRGQPQKAEEVGPLQPADAPREEGSGILRTFFGLFLVPLLVVLVCVGVFIGFGWLAYDHQSTDDYLNDLRSSWRPRRAQAAYELSKVLIADPHALDGDPAARAELRTLFETADDEEMKRYLALVLGYTRDAEAVPLLIGVLDSPSSEMRIYALLALGTVGDPRALEPLARALRDSDPGLRKTAAYGLGELGDARAMPALEPLLQDPTADVRWNAALSLARLGSRAAAPELRRMLDRGLTTQVPGITPAQVEETMVGAVQALAAVEGAAARDLLRGLADDDPSLKVRQAAIEALAAIEG